MQPVDRFASLEEVRREIDHLDRELIRLLARRAQCVKAAAPFKTSETAVRAPERVQQMLAARRQWAEEDGLEAEFVENLFRNITSHFIGSELKDWKESSAPGGK